LHIARRPTTGPGMVCYREELPVLVRIERGNEIARRNSEREGRREEKE